ncbi:MAG: ribbon-helix-helix domain-containing protein [Fervidobacterium sp.]
MIPEYQERIALRISKAEKQKIEQLVREGKYKNLSQVIRAALQKFLNEA